MRQTEFEFNIIVLIRRGKYKKARPDSLDWVKRDSISILKTGMLSSDLRKARHSYNLP
jgi:hypothetical protein